MPEKTHNIFAEETIRKYRLKDEIFNLTQLTHRVDHPLVVVMQHSSSFSQINYSYMHHQKIS